MTKYTGRHRKLLLALDVGTTFSGVSFSILEPGFVPEIKGVTRFPAQEHVGGDSKVPSLLYYDEEGNYRAAGAEAAKIEEDLKHAAEDDPRKSWAKAEWFKLHLRPNRETTPLMSQTIPPLPPKKTVLNVFADFLKYLHQCAITYIRETHITGVSLLASLENHVDFVLTHPNGWEGLQQSQLREAAILGGLVPGTDEGKGRIHFVTEGEAGLHFCVRHGLTTKAMKEGEGVLIVDAGGGTVDLSAYGHREVSKSKLYHEITAPNCILHGSVFVTRTALSHMQDLLRNASSPFLADVEFMAQCFDKTTKLRFNTINEPQFIRFGRSRDNDPTVGIAYGQIKISGERVATFFEPCVNAIIQAIVEQKRRASITKNISSLFLIGGFSASDWLYARLKETLEPLGLQLLRPDTHLNKAVADGAVSFYIDHFVKARVSKFTYGRESYTAYDETNVEHFRRETSAFIDSDGVKSVPHGFSPILEKGTEVMEEKEFRSEFFHKVERLEDLPDLMTDKILCYRGPSANPRWTDVDSQHYTKLCTVRSDISRLKNTLRPQKGRLGKVYYQLTYVIVLSFGLTELKAQVCWKERGREKRSPATLLYIED